MNFDFFDRRSAERFAELLESSTGSRRQHASVPADEALAELVAIGHSLSAAKPRTQVDPEFRVGLRAMLVATAERDGIGRSATAVATSIDTLDTVAPTRVGSRLGALGWGAGRRIRARGAIVIGVAAGAMAVSGISAASEGAAPGDALYGVKRSTERAQLAMAGSDVTRGQLSLDFARTRLAEAVALAGDSAEFPAVLDDMDADTRKGVALLTTAAVARHDVRPLATVSGFADTQRQRLTPVLGRLSASNRERALASITLLDSVRQRADDLRTALGCSSISSLGSDALGPRLRGCITEPPEVTSDRTSSHNGKSTSKSTPNGSTRQKQGNPTPAPGATTAGPGAKNPPALVPQIIPDQTASPTPTASPDGGVLGGVVSGLTGS